ncbi:MAG TPA: MFS transporter [Pyrinomonadaceae bacterium]|jgi:DHA1 family tetracycline resistance protein-like MFS transporter
MSQAPIDDKITPAASGKFFTKPLALIFVTVFIDLIGFGIVLPSLPFYVKGDAFRATPFEIGLLFASYSLMQFIFSPILGSLSDRIGRRPILFLSMIGSAIGYIFIGFAFALWMVFVGRIISGITGGSISTAQAYIADVTTRENRAKGMGLFGATFGLGFIFGPAIGGILSRYGVNVPFLFAAVLSFANAVLLYFILPETVKKDSFDSAKPRKNRFAELFESLRDARFGTLTAVYFFLVVAFSIMTYAFVLYTMQRFGYNAEQNGYIFAFIGILAVIFQGGLFGKVADRFGEKPLMIVGCLMMTTSLFLIPLIRPGAGGLGALLSTIAFLAIGNSMAAPAVTSLASKVSDESEQGKALGVMQSGSSLARAIGPAVGGILLNNALNQVDDFTIRRTFWTASAIMIIAALIAVYFARANRNQAIA